MLSFFWVDRSVESSRIKRAVESVYTAVLPKGSFPFVYLRYVRRSVQPIMTATDLVIKQTI